MRFKDDNDEPIYQVLQDNFSVWVDPEAEADYNTYAEIIAMWKQTIIAKNYQTYMNEEDY